MSSCFSLFVSTSKQPFNYKFWNGQRCLTFFITIIYVITIWYNVKTTFQEKITAKFPYPSKKSLACYVSACYQPAISSSTTCPGFNLKGLLIVEGIWWRGINWPFNDKMQSRVTEDRSCYIFGVLASAELYCWLLYTKEQEIFLCVIFFHHIAPLFQFSKKSMHPFFLSPCFMQSPHLSPYFVPSLSSVYNAFSKVFSPYNAWERLPLLSSFIFHYQQYLNTWYWWQTVTNIT